MENIFEKYTKLNEFLVCLDSDGTVMDTMESKHRKCFGPEMIKIWNLFDKEDYVLSIWYDINLYMKSRGINRFKGLAETFKVIVKEGIEIEDVDIFINWVETTDELSNKSLTKEIEKTKSKILKMAYDWSINVNKLIEELPKEDKPFENVKKGLDDLSKIVDISIVSTANSEALDDEWNRHGFTKHVRVLLGQEDGTKEYCIAKFKEKGYDADKILMVGDSSGDLEAAKKNNIKFYPILINKEGYSWERLINEAILKLMNGTYDEKYQSKLVKEFNDLLK